MENHVHSFKDVVFPSTCVENGYVLHKCDCGYEFKDNFKPKGPHNYEIIEQTLPTCTENGNQILRCTICGETINNVIPPMGHLWSDWNVQIYPTCTETGSKTHTCQRCELKEEQLIPPKGHKLSSPKKSEIEDGMIEYFCENCGEIIKQPTASNKVKGFFAAHKKKIIITLVSLVVVAALVVSTIYFFLPVYLAPLFHYCTAKYYINDANYSEAYYHLKQCDDFIDSEEILKDFNVVYRNTKFHYEYYDDGEISYSSENKYRYTYNEKGHAVELISKHYNENDVKTDESSYKYEREYDEHNNVTKIITKEYDKKGEFVSEEKITYSYEYDKNGNMTEAIKKEYNEEKIITSKTITKFDKNELPIEDTVIIYNKDGKESRTITSVKYNENGNVTDTTVTSYDESGDKTLTKLEITYNENYIPVAGIYSIYDKDDTLMLESELEIELDDKNNPVERTTYSTLYADGEVSDESETKIKYINTYDEDDNLIEVKETNYNDDNDITYTLIKEYDKYGNVIREIETEYDVEEIDQVTTRTYSDYEYYYLPD